VFDSWYWLTQTPFIFIDSVPPLFFLAHVHSGRPQSHYANCLIPFAQTLPTPASQSMYYIYNGFFYLATALHHISGSNNVVDVVGSNCIRDVPNVLHHGSLIPNNWYVYLQTKHFVDDFNNRLAQCCEQFRHLSDNMCLLFYLYRAAIQNARSAATLARGLRPNAFSDRARLDCWLRIVRNSLVHRIPRILQNRYPAHRSYCCICSLAGIRTHTYLRCPCCLRYFCIPCYPNHPDPNPFL
jgi:hypothetical protein